MMDVPKPISRTLKFISLIGLDEREHTFKEDFEAVLLVRKGGLGCTLGMSFTDEMGYVVRV